MLAKRKINTFKMDAKEKEKGDDRTSGPETETQLAFIREVYDNQQAYEAFAAELDNALESGYKTIVIEPNELGEMTAQWISTGRCLHQTAIVTGLGAVACGTAWPDRPLACAPLAFVSLFCTSLYTLSWHIDPCCNYQVESDKKALASLHPQLFNLLKTSSPVVLVRRESKARRRHLMHSGVSILAAVVCIWRLYEAFK